MLDQQEKLWDYDAVEVGQAGPTTEVEITEENIAEYALLAQSPDPRFQRPGVSREYDGAMLAIPTMVITYAPLMREEIAEANGSRSGPTRTAAKPLSPSARYGGGVRSRPGIPLPAAAAYWRSTTAGAASSSPSG